MRHNEKNSILLNFTPLYAYHPSMSSRSHPLRAHHPARIRHPERTKDPLFKGQDTSVAPQDDDATRCTNVKNRRKNDSCITFTTLMPLYGTHLKYITANSIDCGSSFAIYKITKFKDMVGAERACALSAWAKL